MYSLKLRTLVPAPSGGPSVQLQAWSRPRIVIGDKIPRSVQHMVTKHCRPGKARRLRWSAAKCASYLEEVLGADDMIWTLTSMTFSSSPASESWHAFGRTEHAISDEVFHTIAIKAYVTSVDLVWRPNIALRLTPQTTQCLLDYHRDVYCQHMLSYITPTAHAVTARDMQATFKKSLDDFSFVVPTAYISSIRYHGDIHLSERDSERAGLEMAALFIASNTPLIPMMQVVARAKGTNAAYSSAHDLLLSTSIGTSQSMGVRTTQPHGMWGFSSNVMTQNYYWPFPERVLDDVTSLVCGSYMPDVEAWTLDIFGESETIGLPNWSSIDSTVV